MKTNDKIWNVKAGAIGVVMALTGAAVVSLVSAPEDALAGDGRYGERHAPSECAYQPARGVASTVSNYDFDTTLQNVRDEIGVRPLGIFGEVDHQANAEGVGLDLGPTTTIIFGNPVIGTQLMQSNPAVGLELPLKMLVWEDDCGVVRVEYTEPRVLRRRFEIRDLDDVFDTIAGAVGGIVAGATG